MSGQGSPVRGYERERNLAEGDCLAEYSCREHEVTGMCPTFRSREQQTLADRSKSDVVTVGDGVSRVGAAVATAGRGHLLGGRG
jgi:hypothetical protein